MGMDYLLARATDPEHAKAGLNCLDFQSGAVFSAMVVKGGNPYTLAVALEAIKFTGRNRLIIMSDGENAVLVRSLGFLVVTNFPPPQYPLSLGRNFPCFFSLSVLSVPVGCFHLCGVSSINLLSFTCSSFCFSSFPSFSAVLPLQH